MGTPGSVGSHLENFSARTNGCSGDACAVEGAADALHCPRIDPELFGNDAHTGPSRSRQRLMDSFFQRGGYRRPPEAVFLIRDSRKPVTGPVLRPCPSIPPEISKAVGR